MNLDDVIAEVMLFFSWHLQEVMDLTWRELQFWEYQAARLSARKG